MEPSGFVSPRMRLENSDEILEAPEVDTGLRLVKDRRAGIPRQNSSNLDALEFAAGEGRVNLAVDIIPGAETNLGEIARRRCGIGLTCPTAIRSRS